VLDEFTVRDSDGNVILALSSQSVSASIVADGGVRKHRVRRPISTGDSIMHSLGIAEEPSGE
jgi:hypothetical protein